MAADNANVLQRLQAVEEAPAAAKAEAAAANARAAVLQGELDRSNAINGAASAAQEERSELLANEPPDLPGPNPTLYRALGEGQHQGRGRAWCRRCGSRPRRCWPRRCRSCHCHDQLAVAGHYYGLALPQVSRRTDEKYGKDARFHEPFKALEDKTLPWVKNHCARAAPAQPPAPGRGTGGNGH